MTEYATIAGMNGKLTPRQARFVQEYVIDMNGAQAAIRAGYAPGAGARVQATHLLSNPNIRAVIAEKQRSIAARAGWDVEQIVRRAGEIAMQDRPDRVAALALLAKRHPDFRDGPVIDNSQHLHLPPGTTLDDLKQLRESLNG